MSHVKSKQISDFNENIDWNVATNDEIPNSLDVRETFVPEYSIVSEELVGQTITSTSAWSLTLANDVNNNDIGLVTVCINGVKISKSDHASVSGNILNMNPIGYDIDTNDIVEVQYVKTH